MEEDGSTIKAASAALAEGESKAVVASGSSVITPIETTGLPEGHPSRQVVELIFSSGVTLWLLRCGKWR
jgi:hypothetical protein